MKKFFLAALASFAMTCAFAQSNSPKLSVGPEVGLPLGSAQDVFSACVGGSFKLEAPVGKSGFNITFTAGT